MGSWQIQARILKSKRVAATAVGLIYLSPKEIWDLLTLPEGAEIFRVEGRVHGADDQNGHWQEEVIFTAAVRVLFWKTLARTRVHQTIDASNPECITVDFRLLQSDLMSHLEGSWQLQQTAAATSNQPPVTEITYTFEMWPKGVPSGLRFMPGLLGAVKDAVKREVQQLMDKLHYVAWKVRPGVTVRQALQEVAAEVVASGGSFKLLQQAQERSAAAAFLQGIQTKQQHKALSSNSNNDVSSTAAGAAGALCCHALPADLQLDTECEGSEETSDEEVMAEFGSDCYCSSDSPRSSATLSAQLSSSTAPSGSSMDCDSLQPSDSSDSSRCMTVDGACLIVDGGSSTPVTAGKQHAVHSSTATQSVVA